MHIPTANIRRHFVLRKASSEIHTKRLRCFPQSFLFAALLARKFGATIMRSGGRKEAKINAENKAYKGLIWASPPHPPPQYPKTQIILCHLGDCLQSVVSFWFPHAPKATWYPQEQHRFSSLLPDRQLIGSGPLTLQRTRFDACQTPVWWDEVVICSFPKPPSR